MGVLKRISLVFGSSLVLLLLTVLTTDHTKLSEPVTEITTAVGNPLVLQDRYQRWKQLADSPQYRDRLELRLVEPDRHGPTESGGSISLDLKTGILSAAVEGAIPSMSLWVTSDARLYSDDSTSDLTRLGEFVLAGERSVLEVDVSELLQQGLQIGQLIVAGDDPLHAPILAASPSLFQRLLATEQRARKSGGISELLLPVAHANEAVGFPDVFNDLVTEGEDVFFNEDFDGNSRSCGTCHPATNNFTIDVPFIASLHPSDPLFVAEFVPALIFGDPANLDAYGNPQRFENPALMRAFGLIVENVDGMGDLENRFTMRSVPHNIGMSVSVLTPPGSLTPPDERTGWSGEGAPSGIVGGFAASGRVRDFILGAIVQHYPLTMARSFTGPYPDFRAPTMQEMDAMEAFLLSVGRSTELNIQPGAPDELVLLDPGAEAGKALFRDGVPAGNATCNGCHSNGGANVASGFNFNFNTGVELFLQNRMNNPHITVVGEPRPVDGGFGTNPAGDFTSLVEQGGFTNENFGNQTFNTTSVVEAADTPPFFHNNIIETLEGAVAFYNTPEFFQASGRSIPFNKKQTRQVANFLRIINVIDNIENLILPQSNRALFALGQTPVPIAVIKRILRIMLADLQDVLEVLTEGGLHGGGGGSIPLPPPPPVASAVPPPEPLPDPEPLPPPIDISGDAIHHVEYAAKSIHRALNTADRISSDQTARLIRQAQTALEKALSQIRE